MSPTSGYNYVPTRNEIIARAFRIVGRQGEGEPLTAEQLAIGVQALQDMIKSWQNEMVFLWTLVEDSISTVAGTKSYDVSAKNLIGIDKAWYRSNNTDQPIELISYFDYEQLANKSDRSTPISLAYDEQVNGSIWIYPAPADVYTVYFLKVMLMADGETAGSALNFHARWSEALVYGLADRLGDESALPISERQYNHGLAIEKFEKARKGNRARQSQNFVKGAYR
jgi:hypothetical protein